MKAFKINSLVNKSFFKIAFGLMMVETANAVSFMIDTIIAGHWLDESILAAAGIVSPVFALLAIISGVLGAGFQNIAGRQIGEGNVENARDTWKITWRFALAISIIITFIGILFSDTIASILGASSSTMKLHTDSVDLIKGYMTGAVPFVFTALLIPALQINGKNWRVIVSIVATIVVDTIGDLLNACVLDGGGFGMGLATSFSYVASASVLMTGLFDKKAIFRMTLSPCVSHKKGDLLRIISYGLPKATKRICDSLRPVIINRITISVAGASAMVALSVEYSIRYVWESPGVGISGAVLMLMGIFIGEMDYYSIKEMQKTRKILIWVGITALGIVYFASAGLLARLYVTPDSPSYILTVNILRCHAVSLPFLSYNEYSLSYLQAARKLVTAHVFTVLHRFVCIVGFAFILSLFYGVYGVWYAIPLSEIMVAIVITIRLKISDPMKQLHTSDDMVDYSELLSNADQIPAFLERIDGFLKKHNIEEKKSYYVYLFCEEISEIVMKKGFEDRKKHHLNIRIMYTADELTIRTQDDCLSLSDIERSDQSTGTPDDPLLGLHMVFKLAKNVEYINSMNMNHLIIHL